MRKEYFSFLSSDKKTMINAIKWSPDGPAKGVIQIVHGITEYVERYNIFAHYLTNFGFIVVGYDQLGHGRSVVDGKKNYMGPIGSWKNAVEDVSICHNLITKQYPRIPFYIMGFSMGSFLVRQYLSDYNPRIYKVFLVGSAYKPSWMFNIIKKKALKEVKELGEDKPSKKAKELTLEMYNKKFTNPKTDYDWLSSADTAVKEFLNDEHINTEITTSLFHELLDGMTYTCSKKSIEKINKSIPIIIISGQDDPVGDMGKGVTKYYKILKKKGYKTALKLFPTMRHDIFHERYTKDFYDYMLKFMK